MSLPADVREGHEATIRDVASQAGVSISTVSLVMNGAAAVRETTRERVLGAAAALGYVPRSAARQLARRQTGNVGFVLREDHFTRGEPFYTRIFLGSEFEARHAGVYVLLTTIPSAYTPQRDAPRFLRERNVDGLVVAGSVPAAFFEEAERVGVPLVLVDFEYNGYPSVTVDNAGGGVLAAEHLRARGHTRLAFAGAEPEHPSMQARLAGFRSAAGTSVAVFQEAGNATRTAGRALGATLLAAPERPTAVFCANDALALGVLDAAKAEGLRVPDDLAIVGFDDVEGAGEASPGLTTLHVYKEQLGELALRLLCRTHPPHVRRRPLCARRRHHARGHRTHRARHVLTDCRARCRSPRSNGSAFPDPLP